MLLGDTLALDDFERAGAVGRPNSLPPDLPAIPRSAALLDLPRELLPLKVARGDDGDIRRDIAALEICVHLVALEGRDAFLRAKDAVAQRVVGEIDALGPVIRRHHRL